VSAKVFALRRRQDSRRVMRLPSSVRTHMEPRFGASFSHVRVHTGHDAARSAAALNARAYTFGRDVVFGAGQYSPQTAAGRRLIAHELAHVVQQQKGGAAAQRVMRSPFPGCDRKTTGVDDADARMEAARKRAAELVARARARLAKPDIPAIALVEKHFHCPASGEFARIANTFAAIASALPLVEPTCLDAKAPTCKAGENGDINDRAADFCPVVFKVEAFRFAGLFVDAAAHVQGKDANLDDLPGLKNTCLRKDACYGDFTIPAANMLGNAISYAVLAAELSGHPLHAGTENPCAPSATSVLVDVPPGAVSDPNLIREHSSFRPMDEPHTLPPAGTRLMTVYEDRAGKRFIYHSGMPGAAAVTAAEAAQNPPRLRFYFPPGHALHRK
jgi:hypothetical protein